MVITTRESFGMHGSTSSTLGCHIPSVISGSAKEQVIWSDTRRIVALMEHPQTVRDWAVMQLPRHTIGEGSLPSNLDHAVALLESSCGPDPTGPEIFSEDGTVFANLRPETFLNRDSWMWGRKPCTASAAKLCPSQLHRIGLRKKFLAAELANSSYRCPASNMGALAAAIFPVAITNGGHFWVKRCATNSTGKIKLRHRVHSLASFPRALARRGGSCYAVILPSLAYT